MKIASAFVILLWIAAVLGYIINIIKLLWVGADPITAWFVLRLVGIFVAPIGAIIGWM